MTLPDLIALLEGAEQGSWELDAETALLAGLPQEFFGSYFGTVYVDGPDCFGEATWGGTGRLFKAPKYTSSVDAAIALAIHLFDDGVVDIEVTHRSYAGGKVLGRAEICGPRAYGRASAKTPALALVLATLRALQAKTGDRTAGAEE